MRAANIAPGLNRKFAAEQYSFLGEGVFEKVREEARAAIKTDITFEAVGSDIDPEAVAIATENAKRAGVSHLVHFHVADARKFWAEPEMIVLANPPYGERLGTPQEVEQLCADFGRAMAEGEQKSAYIISSLPDFERHYGKKATRRRKLYNGMLPCQLFMYF